MCARGDDRLEARALRSEAAHAELQLERHLPLGASHDPGFQDLAQGLVGEPGRLEDAGQLAARP